MIDELATATDADVLIDMPSVLVLARLYYPTEVVYELTLFEAAEIEDFQASRALVPADAVCKGSERCLSEGQDSLVVSYIAAGRF